MLGHLVIRIDDERRVEAGCLVGVEPDGGDDDEDPDQCEQPEVETTTEEPSSLAPWIVLGAADVPTFAKLHADLMGRAQGFLAQVVACYLLGLYLAGVSRDSDLTVAHVLRRLSRGPQPDLHLWPKEC